MCANEKSVTALGEMHRKFVAEPVCLFGSNLSVLECLANVICDGATLALNPSRKGKTSLLFQKEFAICG